MKSKARSLGLLFLLMALTFGCGNFFNNLRRDLDEGQYYEPTVGGMYPEGGFLENRMPASLRENSPAGRASWINEDQAEAARRDALRKLPSYADTPNLAPPVQRTYQTASRVTREDFVDHSQSEGSLWASTGQTNYFFTKNRVRSVGDLITLTVGEQLVKDIANEVKKTMTRDEAEMALAQAREKLKAQKAGAVERAARTPASPAQNNEENAENNEDEGDENEPKITFADVDITQEIPLKAGDTLMAEIVERFPNGNYKIRAVKRISFRGSPRLISLMGVARANDVTDNDKVDSGNLYEYRLSAYR